MLIILHITTAVLGLVLAGLTAIRPTRRGRRAVGALTALTLYSGSLLVIRLHAALTTACLSGLGYLMLIGLLTGLGARRAAR